MMDSSRSYQQFFAEMKRRRVFRVMAVYGATAFVVLQVADLLAQGMGLSDQVLRITTFLVLIGFPIAIVLAWAFDSTPEGVKRTAGATPGELEAIIAQPAHRRWTPGLLALLGAALLFGGWWMGRQGAAPELNLAVSEARASEFRRIAVLPFDDLGGNAENDPFLSGMHVDIHGKLQGLADLRVSSLGSVRDYGGSGSDSDSIANDLAVDYLLRGSVRRAGNQARINVQLTDVALGEDIWVGEFDHEVTADNLFAIQSEIAKRVAEKLEATLSPAEVQRLEASLSTDDLAAINAYHRGRAILLTPRVGDTHEDGIAFLDRALELAPEFVEAWALRAWQQSFTAQSDGSVAPRALEAVERTEALAPGSLEAVKARGWYTYYVDRDFQRALELMTQAEGLAPSDSDVLTGIALLQHRLGEFAEGTRTMKRAVDLDPQDSGTLTLLGNMLQRMARWDASRAVLERALAIDPSNADAKFQLVLLTVQGDRDPVKALGLAAEFGLEPDGLQGWYATLDRDYDRAATILSNAVPADTVERAGILAQRVWVEQMRGGDAAVLRDSLVTLGDAVDPATDTPAAALIAAEYRLTLGPDAAAWALWDAAVQGARESRDQAERIGQLWWTARLAAQFGRPEEAFPLLDEAVGRPAGSVWSLADLTLDPRFDSIRDDPRFVDFIARQRAYEEEQARLAEAQGPWLP